MWVFTPVSFLSIVASKTSQGKLLVRARLPTDIQRLFPKAKVIKTPDADYLYRAEIPRSLVAGVIADQLTTLNYHNVKGAISKTDHKRHRAMMRVWEVMNSIQWD